MKKFVLLVVALLATAVAAHAQPIEVVLTTTAKAITQTVNGVTTIVTPAPTTLYGLELVLQLPVGVTPRLDPAAPGTNFVDPASIILADNSTLNTGTSFSAAYFPSATPATVGDTVKLVIANPYGFKFGIFGALGLDYKPGFVRTYNATTGTVTNVNFTVASFRAVDVNGNTIPSTQTTGSVSKSYSWQ